MQFVTNQLLILIMFLALVILSSILFNYTTITPRQAGLILFTTFFTTLYTAASLLSKTFRETLPQVKLLSKAETSRIPPEQLTFAISYILPYIAVYSIPHHYPAGGKQHGFYAWATAQTLIFLLYERPIGKMNPDFKTTVFRNTSAIAGIISPIIAYTAITTLKADIAAQAALLGLLSDTSYQP